jgi:hypothetical protein
VISPTVRSDRREGDDVQSQEDDQQDDHDFGPRAQQLPPHSHRLIPVSSPRKNVVVGEQTDPVHNHSHNHRQHDNDDNGAQNWHNDALDFLMSGQQCSHRGPDEEHPDQPVEKQEREDPREDQRGHSEPASSVSHITLYPAERSR